VTVAYATSEELAAWLGASAPADGDRLLLRASELIDDALIAPFCIDEATQLPTDTDIAAALRDAACAVVEQWIEVGEANDIDGLAGASVAVGSFQGQRAPRISPRALGVLRSAGLMGAGRGGAL